MLSELFGCTLKRFEIAVQSKISNTNYRRFDFFSIALANEFNISSTMRPLLINSSLRENSKIRLFSWHGILYFFLTSPKNSKPMLVLLATLCVKVLKIYVSRIIQFYSVIFTHRSGTLSIFGFKTRFAV